MMVYPALYTSTFFSANTQGNISGAAAGGEMSSNKEKRWYRGEGAEKKLPPFSLIRDFSNQNACGNVSRISVNHTDDIPYMEILHFYERDKFFGFLHKLITDLAQYRVNNLSTETVKGHLMLKNCREIGIP